MKKAGRDFDVAEQFEQAQRSHGAEFAGGFDEFEAQADMGLTGKVIELIGPGLGKDAAHGAVIIQAGRMQEDAAIVEPRVVIDVLETRMLEDGGGPNDAMYLVTFFEQQF